MTRLIVVCVLALSLFGCKKKSSPINNGETANTLMDKPIDTAPAPSAPAPAPQ